MHIDILSLTAKSPLLTVTSFVTKRDVLWESSKVFDTLSLLLLVTIKAKIFIHKLQQHSVEWDEPLINEDQQQQMHIAEDIQDTMSVVISR